LGRAARGQHRRSHHARIDLNSFDHFIRQLNEPDGERVGVPTLFFPMTRVERITLDEPTGSIPSMDELFARKLAAG